MDADALKAFISKNKKDIIESISIRNEIADWKIEHGGNAPIILVDLHECLHLLVLNDCVGVVLGGHFDRYNKMMRQFLKNITEAGAKLVFFMPGRLPSDEIQFFIPKAEETYIQSLQILDALKEGANLKFFLQKTNHANLLMELPFNQNLMKLVAGFGDFHVTYGQHNQEIARYAKQNARNVLALITDDVDFIAFPASFEFWWAKSINFKEMTCERYNKNRLYDKLGFDHGAVQMQLLHALSGTIFLPKFVLDDFRDRLAKMNTNPKQRGKTWNVLEYVKCQPLMMVGNKLSHDLQQISRDAFGDDFSNDQLNAIANGLAHYDLDFEESNKSNMNPFKRGCKNQYPFLYKLATEKICNVHITYMDLRNCKSNGYADLVIPILMKMYGILFNDYPRRPKKYKICMKHAHDEPSKVTEEVIIYPSIELPSLSHLVFETKRRQYDGVRVSLLEWILDLADGTVKKVQRLKNYQKYAAVIITLLYLVKQKALTSKEANIILYTEHQVQSFNVWKTGYPDRPSAHLVHIAHLYVKMYELISHCLEVCALGHMTDVLRFDGASFHINMKKFENDTKQLAVLRSIWIFS